MTNLRNIQTAKNQRCYITDSSAEDVESAAKNRIKNYGKFYAKKAKPMSPNKMISGNTCPNQTSLSWLANKSKCNQFVGDVLFDAGYEMPTYKMKDGSLHYMNAEMLPHQRQHFIKITTKDDIKAGDLLVRDYSSRNGENGAHVEIITNYNNKSETFTLAGAHSDGASESIKKISLSNYIFNKSSKYWKILNDKIYILRPIKQSE